MVQATGRNAELEVAAWRWRTSPVVGADLSNLGETIFLLEVVRAEPEGIVCKQWVIFFLTGIWVSNVAAIFHIYYC